MVLYFQVCLTSWRDVTKINLINFQLQSIVLLQIIKFHCRSVLVKGGDLPNSSEAIDIFYDGNIKIFIYRRHNGQNKTSKTQQFFLLLSAVYIQIYALIELNFLVLSFAGQEFYELSSPRVNTRNTHGTGCTMASCIAAELAKGSSMLSAVKVGSTISVIINIGGPNLQRP